MDEINLYGIEVWAGHGCLPQEKKSLGLLRANVVLYGDWSNAGLSDELKDTVDYVAATELVIKEMKINSKTVEHVAERVAAALLKTFALVESVEVEIEKVNPPVHSLENFSVLIQRDR